MWLIEVETQKLQEFLGDVPPYAVLSHRWGLEELNFKEVSKKRIDRTKKGYQKLVNACRIAAKHQLRYLWIDTCCIDKRSSAELSEAINSMFAWYKHANVCLAYLEDISSDLVDESFRRSAWFTRAWTLQELLAPQHVAFYNRDWQVIGYKDTEAALIEDITGIPDRALLNSNALWEFSFVEKMSWASGRQATRPEDIAYSLLGIFNLYMPLLYGEGERAFIRLQEEIIRNTNTSVFLLWGLNCTTLKLLASSPDDFQYAKRMDSLDYPFNQSFSLTNLGLEIEIDIMRCALGVYAIIIANRIVDPTYVLILREHSYIRDAYYKVSVVALPCTPDRLSKRKKILVMRGTAEQSIEEEEGLRHNDYSSVGRPYTIQIRCAKSIMLRPVRGHDRYESRVEEARWSRPSQRDLRYWDESLGPNILEARWFRPTMLGILRMSCQLQRSWTLRSTFFFDFASNPCLLLGFHGEGKYPDGERDPTTLQGISDTYGSVKSTCLSADGWIQVRPVRIVEETVSLSFIIRGNPLGKTCAKLPTELVPLGQTIWVHFVDPPYPRASPWLLSFSEDAPVDGW